jgi:hypothetical protein
MPDAGCRMPDAGCRMPDAGCRMPDAGCRMPQICQNVRLRYDHFENNISRVVVFVNLAVPVCAVPVVRMKQSVLAGVAQAGFFRYIL